MELSSPSRRLSARLEGLTSIPLTSRRDVFLFVFLNSLRSHSRRRCCACVRARLCRLLVPACSSRSPPRCSWGRTSPYQKHSSRRQSRRSDGVHQAEKQISSLCWRVMYICRLSESLSSLQGVWQHDGPGSDPRVHHGDVHHETV